MSSSAEWPLVLHTDTPAAPILEVVAKLRAATPHSRLGVGGQWSSPKVDAVPAEVWPVAEAILKALPAGPWVLSWWANVLTAGDAMERHDHRHSHLGGENAFAAVYYAQADGGEIRFHPDGGEELSVEVGPGVLLVFPATLEHSVPPYQGQGERVSLAFNVRRPGGA